MGTVFQKAPKSSGTDLEWCIQIFSREKWRKSGWIQPFARQNQVSIHMLIDSLFSCSFWQIIVSESVCTSCISQTFTKHLDKSDASFWWLFCCSKKVAWLVPSERQSDAWLPGVQKWNLWKAMKDNTPSAWREILHEEMDGVTLGITMDRGHDMSKVQC